MGFFYRRLSDVLCCQSLASPVRHLTLLVSCCIYHLPPASISSRLEHGQRLIGWAWSTARTLTTSHRK